MPAQGTNGETLRRIREDRGWSQAELSRRSGVNQQTISHYEANTRKPKPENLYRLAAALSVRPEVLNPTVSYPEPDLGLLAGNWHRFSKKDQKNALVYIRALLETLPVER
jgi:transcriptional regulator with XRE-family HTH domain